MGCVMCAVKKTCAKLQESKEQQQKKVDKAVKSATPKEGTSTSTYNADSYYSCHVEELEKEKSDLEHALSENLKRFQEIVDKHKRDSDEKSQLEEELTKIRKFLKVQATDSITAEIEKTRKSMEQKDLYMSKLRESLESERTEVLHLRMKIDKLKNTNSIENKDKKSDTSNAQRHVKSPLSITELNIKETIEVSMGELETIAHSNRSCVWFAVTLTAFTSSLQIIFMVAQAVNMTQNEEDFHTTFY
eukprot:jgi/Bigna1/79120/fgenesh1_pg.59_\